MTGYGKWFVVALMILVILPVSKVTAKQRCSFCNQVISGTFYRYDQDVVVCKACEAKLPKCERCGYPMDRWVAYGDVKLCLTCSTEVKTCDKCGDPLLNKFYEYKVSGKTIRVCQECKNTAPACDGCGAPLVGAVYAYGNKNFCDECNKTKHRCNLCKRPVDRKFWYYDLDEGRVYYCADCYHNKKHCQVCGLPFEGGYDIDGKIVCSRCYKKLPRCGACGVPIHSHSWIYPGSNSVFCTKCAQSRPRCDSCGVPLGAQFEALADGRRLCPTCKSTAIFTKDKADPVYKAASKDMAKLGFSLKNLPELILTDRNHLEQLAREIPEGDPDRTTGLFYQRNSKTKIYIITGLPKNVHLSVAAHELAHAWQHLNFPKLKSMELKEGFAEWVSYHVLAANKLTSEMERIANRNDVYGNGFRKLHAIEKKQGKQAVLDFLKTAR